MTNLEKIRAMSAEELAVYLVDATAYRGSAHSRLIDRDALESKICWACSGEFPDAPCEPSDCRILEVIKNAPFIEIEECEANFGREME